MIRIEDHQISELLDYPALIDALATAFRTCDEPPVRQQYTIDTDGDDDAHLLLMPAWRSGQKIGIKIASVFPGNASRDIPTVNASYLLLDANTGVPEMIMDATELTRRRTAAASALAARYLARKLSTRLLMVGTGAMSTHLIRAHCANLPIASVQVWGRRHERASAIADQFLDEQFSVEPVTDLQAAVSSADIISCATMATESLIQGDWLMPGQHLDLVGSFTPDMREADDSALRRADIYVDTRSGAMQEAGELVQGIRDGVISDRDVLGDLFELTRGTCEGRLSDAAITLFKSVGNSLEDLAAAELLASRLD